jgi:Tfp pilus assembly protein PilF
MSAPLSDERRDVIPRWRDVKKTIALGELLPSRSVESIVLPRDFLTDKIRDWEANKIWPLAAEVAGAALVLNELDAGQQAAEFIVGQVPDAPPQVREIAAKILRLRATKIPDRVDRDAIVISLREAKMMTRIDPRDAFAWVELSRNYAILGQIKPALHSVKLALALAPNHRYVLRSAARLYTHIGEHSRAYDLIRRAEATPYDPWLLSAEIATAALAEKSSSHLKVARKLLESSNISAFDKTELASALATEDANAGNLRGARRLFRESLERPNDNSIAQARWAASHKIIDLNPDVLRVRQAYEARAWYAFYAGDWALGLKAGTRWLKDQPFSASPAVHASYIAAVALENHDRAIEILDIGRTANPRDPNILNNLSYSLACTGQLDKADSTLSLISRNALSSSVEAAVLATAGLVRYRRGNTKQGRHLYEQAMEKARGSSNDRLYAKAALFLALEELRAGTDDAIGAVENAIHLSSKYQNADFNMLRSKVETAVEQFTAAGSA